MRLAAITIFAFAAVTALAAPRAALEPATAFTGISARANLRVTWDAGDPVPVAFELQGPASMLLKSGQGWPTSAGALSGEIISSHGKSARRIRLRFEADESGSHALSVFVILKDGRRVQAQPEGPGLLELKIIRPKRKLTQRERMVFEEAQKQADDPGLSDEERKRLKMKPWEGKSGYDLEKRR